MGAACAAAVASPPPCLHPRRAVRGKGGREEGDGGRARRPAPPSPSAGTLAGAAPPRRYLPLPTALGLCAPPTGHRRRFLGVYKVSVDGGVGGERGWWGARLRFLRPYPHRPPPHLCRPPTNVEGVTTVGHAVGTAGSVAPHAPSRRRKWAAIDDRWAKGGGGDVAARLVTVLLPRHAVRLAGDGGGQRGVGGSRCGGHAPCVGSGRGRSVRISCRFIPIGHL